MTTDTSGFYRIDGDGHFQLAQNFVYAPDYTLLRADHASYTYPTAGGWVWFNDLAAAQAHFAVTVLPNKSPEPVVPPSPLITR